MITKLRFILTFVLIAIFYDGITSINWLGKKITIDIPKKEILIN